MGFSPISMTATGRGYSPPPRTLLEGREGFFQALFINVTPGIANPNVFNPPDSCQ